MAKTEAFIVQLAVGGFLAPIGQRSAYTASRLAVLADGTTAPVLQLLAAQKFEKWPEEQFPFWIDGSPDNETLVNVGLATRSARPKSGRLRRSAFGAPAGTKEYMRQWRALNREKTRASARRYAQKRASVLKQMAEASDRTSRPPDDDIVSDPIIEKLRRVVGEIS